MTSVASGYFAKAHRAVTSAKLLLAQVTPEFAASRAYYGMFYVASGLLAERGKKFSKHSGTHAAFLSEFVRSGEVEQHYYKWLIEAFKYRLADDYDPLAEVGLEEATEVISHAEQFLALVPRLLPEG